MKSSGLRVMHFDYIPSHDVLEDSIGCAAGTVVARQFSHVTAAVRGSGSLAQIIR